MSVRFHPEAEAELAESTEYYEDIEPGLGWDFALEVYSAIERAHRHPEAWTLLEGDIRRSLVRRFPYGVLYALENDDVFVLAVMHLHREPNYWKNRL
ncbi:type II toxin-antitoxin system RelE/ParE family toxin [Halomonas sp. G11]|uniref:type II toxin-antitoxin system RelE/ParE family toxin n=1 Tax=Halomonas sp. G11 TaxID=1684425 RepID=UPI0009EF29CB|nr:type II toxin-antitoxin system RelE/ParE family toxin [Halomonas sp. G11]